MKSKAVKIVLDAVLSVVVLFVSSILLAWILGTVFGGTKGADGKEYGNYNSGILLVIASAITVTFAVWFYKMLSKKSNKIEE